LARLIYAERNNPFRGVRVRAVGMNRMIDLAPRAALVMDMGAADNERGLTWTNACLVPMSIAYTRDPQSGAMATECTLDGLTDDTQEFSGETPEQPVAIASAVMPPS
jgi:hypothetical protein